MTDDWGQDLDLGPLPEVHDVIGHRHRAIGKDREMVLGAIRDPDPSEKQTQVVVDLGHGPDRRTGVVGGCLLVDGDGRGKALDRIDVGLVDPAEELAGIGRQRFDVAPLSFGVDGVEGQGALPAARNPGKDRQGVLGNGEGKVLEVIFPRPLHHDVIAIVRHKPRYYSGTHPLHSP